MQCLYVFPATPVSINQGVQEVKSYAERERRHVALVEGTIDEYTDAEDYGRSGRPRKLGGQQYLDQHRPLQARRSGSLTVPSQERIQWSKEMGRVAGSRGKRYLRFL